MITKLIPWIVLMIIASFLPWIVISLVYASFLEWNLHKHLMHTNRKWLSYPFKTHALVHHQKFRADNSYHLQDEDDKHTIPMAWWNGFTLTVIATIPMIVIGYFLSNFYIPIQTFIVVGLYYCTYEYFHWCMHLPKKPKPRWFENKRWFKYIDGRHHLHHQRMNTTNFNVVWGLWDWLMGTHEIPEIN